MDVRGSQGIGVCKPTAMHYMNATQSLQWSDPDRHRLRLSRTSPHSICMCIVSVHKKLAPFAGCCPLLPTVVHSSRLASHRDQSSPVPSNQANNNTSRMRVVRDSGAGSGLGPKLWWWVTPVVPFSNPGRASWWVTASVTPKGGNPSIRGQNGAKRPKTALDSPGPRPPPGSNMPCG